MYKFLYRVLVPYPDFLSIFSGNIFVVSECYMAWSNHTEWNILSFGFLLCMSQIFDVSTKCHSKVF